MNKKEIIFKDLVEMDTIDFYNWWKENQKALSISDYLLMLVIQSKQIRFSVRPLNKKL